MHYNPVINTLPQDWLKELSSSEINKITSDGTFSLYPPHQSINDPYVSGMLQYLITYQRIEDNTRQVKSSVGFADMKESDILIFDMLFHLSVN